MIVKTKINFAPRSKVCDMHLFKVIAIFEWIISKCFYPIADGNACKFGTPPKCIVPNCCYAVRDSNICKAATIIESFISNICDAIANNNFFYYRTISPRGKIGILGIEIPHSSCTINCECTIGKQPSCICSAFAAAGIFYIINLCFVAATAATVVLGILYFKFVAATGGCEGMRVGARSTATFF